jgi:hypothetical protein
MGLLQDTAQMKLDVLSAMHLIAEPWRLITPTSIKNCFVKCCYSVDHVTNSDNSRVKPTEEDGMTGTVYSLLEWSLRTTQHVTMLSRSVESLECQPGVRSKFD